MKFIDIPDDIFYNIYHFLGKNKISFYNLLVALNPNNYKLKRKFAAYRIKLFTKIFYEFKIQNRFICIKLRSMIYREDFNFYGIPKKFLDIECIYYAPHVHNGLCRFCCKKENMHYYKKSLIDKYFTYYITNPINT